MIECKDRKIVIAISGASGSIYACRLLDLLNKSNIDPVNISVIISKNAEEIWKSELPTRNIADYPYRFYENSDFNAPCASGSSSVDTMIIVPSSMGVVGRIASGVSTDLTTRAADVMIKERRTLIIVPRETPYSLIHLKNMTLLTEAGVIICPATPSFYSHPSSIEELADTVVHRIMQLAAIPVDMYRWGEKKL